MAGHMNGTVHLRPARAGLLVKAEGDGFLRAVELASSVWGGKYFPIFAPSDRTEDLRYLEALSVDFLHAVDTDPDLESFAKTTGFQWRGGPGWGPFDSSEGRLANRLLDPTWLLPQLSRQHRSLPVWADDDPLSSIFAAWFGRYGPSEFERSLEAIFAEGADRVEVASCDPLPKLAGAVTPIQLTSLDIRYTGDGESATIVVFGPGDNNAPFVLWNLQARGGSVFPWPVGYETSFTGSLEAWLDDAQASQHLGIYQSGDGSHRAHYVGLFNLDGSEDVPDAITSIAEARELVVSTHGAMPPGGWSDVHPMSTEFRRSFSIEVSNQEQSIRVPVPHAEPVGGWRDHRPGVIALDVTIHNEDGRPGFTMAIPRIRELSSLLQNYLNIPEPFHRPGGDGRILGADITEPEIKIAFVSSLDIFAELLGTDWKCSQSDNGRLTTRLIEVLGGASSTAANQPSIREVLTQAGLSPRGKPLPALIERARSSQGPWPGLLSNPQRTRQYPSQVTKWLINQKILKPVLPVKCPSCATETTFTAEDLSTVVECELCSETFPLGFALAQESHNEWLYRLTGNVDPKKMAEALPIMAAMTILSGYRRLSTSSVPNVLGLKITSGKKWSCELDIAAFVECGGPSVAVVGEVKSFRDSIDESDIANLVRVQERLRSKHIECVILGATLREQLDSEEISAFRALCENAPDSINRRNSTGLVLPIVLTRKDLSVPYFDENHPTKWGDPGGGLSELATESCRRNLGLTDLQHEWTGSQWSWRPVWQEPHD
jgi:ribosomal protein S27E